MKLIVLTLLFFLIETLTFKTFKPVKIVEPVKAIKQEYYTVRMKITEYYLPTVIGFTYSKDGYENEVQVGNIVVFLKDEDSRKLATEGFVKLVYENDKSETKSVFVDHNLEIQPFPKNASEQPLKHGDLASGLEKGTEVEIDGVRKIIKDTGSKLSKTDIDVFVKDYKNKTVYKTVKIFYRKKRV